MDPGSSRINGTIFKHASNAEAGGNRIADFARIEGERGSPAASLDFAISKQTQWLLDMFGVSREGTANIKRLVQRSNSDRKRPGPVVISVNSSILAPAEIKIRVDTDEITDCADIAGLVRKLSRNDVRVHTSGGGEPRPSSPTNLFFSRDEGLLVKAYSLILFF